MWKACCPGNPIRIPGWASGRDLGRDFDATLERVRRITRERKKSWIGLNAEVAILPLAAALPYGLLRRLIEKAMSNPEYQIKEAANRNPLAFKKGDELWAALREAEELVKSVKFWELEQ